MIALIKCYIEASEERISRKTGNIYNMQMCKLALIDTSTNEVLETKKQEMLSDGQKVGYCEQSVVSATFDRRGDIFANVERPKEIQPAIAEKLAPGIVPKSIQSATPQKAQAS